MRYFILLSATAPLIRMKEPEQGCLQPSSKIVRRVEVTGREATCLMYISAQTTISNAQPRGIFVEVPQ